MAESVSGPDLTALREAEGRALRSVEAWLTPRNRASVSRPARQILEAYRAAVEARVRAEVEAQP